MLFLVTSHNRQRNARAMPVTYLVKLTLEAAQIASTAADKLGVRNDPSLYKPTHQNHPACRWAARSWSHVVTVCLYALAMCDEYRIALRPPAEQKPLAVESKLRYLLNLALEHGGDPQGTSDPPPLTVDSAGDELADWIKRKSRGSVYRGFRLYLARYKSHVLGRRWQFSLAAHPKRRREPRWLSRKRQRYPPAE